MQPLEALRALVRPLARRVALLAARGVVRLSDDSTGLQGLQAEFLTDEVRGPLERFGEYGWSSRPPRGSEVVALFFNGNRDHGVVVAVEDRAGRPTDLAEGESCAYNGHGVRIYLRADGSIEITAAGGVDVDAPSLRLSGNLVVDGTIDAAGSIASAGSVSDAAGPLEEIRERYNLHTHAGVETGSGTSAQPLPPMD